MNVNMNVSTGTTPKKLDIVNAPSKTEQFKKVLDNHEFRFRNLTNENAQKKCVADENTTSGIEKVIAYGNDTTNLNESEDTTGLKAETIKFIEISIDAAKQKPVKLDGELRAELISFIQTAVDGLKQTPENLTKDFAKKDANSVSEVQIQQLLGSENLTPETKDMLSKTFELIGKSDTNMDGSLQIQNVLQSLITMFETYQSALEPENKVNNLKFVDLEKKLYANLIGVENLTPDVKNTDEPLPIQNVLEKLISNSKDNRSLKTEIINFVQTVTDALNSESENKINASKPQIQQIPQSLRSIFETQKSNLKPVDLEKMLNDHLVGVENLTPETKNTLKNDLSKTFTLIEESDKNNDEHRPIHNVLEQLTKEVSGVKGEVDTSYLRDSKNNASKPQIQQILQSLSSMVETQQSVSKSENQQNDLKPVDLEKMLDEHLIGVIPKDNINVQEAQIQQILQSLSSMFQTAQSVSVIENQQIDISSMNIEQLIGVENLTPETKEMLKRSFSEILVLVEKSETSVEGQSKILQVLQKLTTEVHVVKGDLNLLKMPSDRNVIVNSEVRSIKDNSKSSFEEKFLGNLISGDKDEMKISKAVNFMNQFKDAEILSTGKVEIPNVVIDKNNFTVDIVKSMKFMETNNIKNLTVTMSPKELGEITIKLTVESGIMKAFISAQNKDTFNLLNSNMQDISDKLKNMDIKIQSLDINIYEDSTFFNKESNKKNNSQQEANDSKTNSVLEEKEDVLIRDNYAIEQSTVNKFV